ncbi:MAG: YciI family protein [Gemmatimonadaceae bacterium]
MKDLMLINHDERYRSEPIPQALMDAMDKFISDGFASGVLKDTAGLKSTSEAIRVRSSGGKLKVIDGPFSEAKEVVGGYALVDVSSKEEARKVATQFMDLHRVHWPSFEGECEVRQLDDA